ncbi:hypothetical protein C5167_020563 [Papaver somniferum]|uniref:Endonuclease/exonuclease/phosphatase domain-containing protein n=1 Tax=Papaver somniferum TaxID=3469 RepID=A0A4Y7ITX8_PAPSO|nr:hypothetical protein C5167_020563 [Papaver somniferum]
MNAQILSWNVQGIRDPTKQAVISDVLNRWNVNMVILQETKIPVINSTISRNLWNRAGVELAYQPSIGASGGLCIMWRGEEFELLDRHDDVYSLAFLLKSRRTDTIQSAKPRPVKGNPGYVLWKKLQWLKQKLKTWNWETFGSTNAKMGGLLEEIKEINFKEERNCATMEESKKKVDLKLEYKRWARLEEIRLRQKNKDKWVEEGDNNTKYFHKIVNHRRKSNYISC